MLPDRKFIGRGQLLEDICAALSGDSSAGAVLVGESGIGKSAILRRGLGDKLASSHVIQLRGAALSASMPYGALSSLLWELGPDVNQHPVFLIGRLAELLRAQAAGRSIVFAVDNADHLDGFSATVLCQLVLNGTARVLVAARDLAGIPEELIGLWREGSLHRFDVGPFRDGEAHEYLVSELGNSVSRPAFEALWSSSAGNPLHLRMHCYDLQEANQLIFRDEVWVLRPGSVKPGRHSNDALSEHIAGLPASQMEMVELLSLAGALPLSIMLRVGAGSDVDELQERGLLSNDQNQSSVVCLRNLLLGRTVASRLTAGRRRMLYEELTERGGAEDETLLDPTVRADWVRSFGGTLSASEALAAVEQARSRSDHAAVVEYASSSGGLRTTALVVEIASALTELGEYASAKREISSFRSEAAGSLSLADWDRLTIAECRLLHRTGDSGFEELLERVEQRLSGSRERGSGEPELASLSEELMIAEAEFASFDGRFFDNAMRLNGWDSNHSEKEINLRVQLGSWLCEAWAMTARQHEARALADRLMELLSDPRLIEKSRTVFYRHASIVYRMTGGWFEFQLAANAAASGTGGDKHAIGRPGEAVDGLGYVYLDQTDTALDFLRPALSQLQLNDPSGVLLLAQSAAAYCYARRGESAKARELLRPETPSGRSSWQVRREVAHFAALTTALIESPQRAISQLNHICERDRHQGVGAYELIGLCRVVRLGGHSAIERLLTVAASTQGLFAELCETYAKGLGNKDSHLLLEAMDIATSTGDYAFASEVGTAALSVVSALGDRAQVRHVQRRIRAVLDRTSESSAMESRLETLTSREREIAYYASRGVTNKEIAEDMCVSVRTIEGHLYRAYAKLCVENRTELLAALAMENST